MVGMTHPFQKICYVPGTDDRPPFLLCAAGSNILVFDFARNKILSQGPPFESHAFDASSTAESTDGPSATKRRKLDHTSTSTLSREVSEESVEIVAERRKGERKRPRIESGKLPNVSHLLATSDGGTVLAATTEDKSITVFSLSASGILMVESRRSMPKRLCSVTLSPDERTVIAADKFGDVYSLPLHPAQKFVATSARQESRTALFQPAATELTVHTKGNLEALRQQREQKKINPKKEGPDFEHKLLLGHVSLLTDVAIATPDSNNKRQFLLTSDRDEHIRISRYPQSHVIEGYCLGMREFVSQICVVPWNQKLVLAGTGEPSLRVFEWQKGALISEVLFEGTLRESLKSLLTDKACDRTLERLAVSGIWPVPSTGVRGMVLVALEGIPGLISLLLDESGKLQYHQTIPLGGNALDTAMVAGERVRAVVSVDNIHIPGSMSTEKTGDKEDDIITTIELEQETQRWVECKDGFRLNDSNVEVLDRVPNAPRAQLAGSSRARGEYSSLGEFLYGLENLRKRRGAQNEDIEDGDAAGEEAD